MDKIIAGYTITDSISVEGQHFALGHKENAADAYVVWQTNEDMSQFYFGRYFAHKHAAISDMVLRATYQLQRPDGIPLSVDFLTENAREAVELQYIEEKAMDSIREALEYNLDHSDAFTTNLTAEDIIKNPAFLEQAKESYLNMDHSEEKFAMHQSIEEILEANPEFLNPTPVKASLNQIIQSAQSKQSTTSRSSVKEMESAR